MGPFNSYYYHAVSSTMSLSPSSMPIQLPSVNQLARPFIILMIIIVAATPYSYAFASSFTSAALGKANNRAAAAGIVLLHPRQQQQQHKTKAQHQHSNPQLSTSSRWTRITTTKSSEDTTGEDTVNDHGIDELLEQPQELVQAAGELAFVGGDNNEDNLVQDGGSSEASRLRGGSTSASTNKSLLPATPPPLPTIRQYLKFALPCLGLWVANPLLSLVDTAFVGLSAKEGASSAQLAALGPATTLYVLSFVSL